MNEISGRESLLSSRDNHNKDICEIQNYFVNRESAELLLSRREKQIEETCEYCLTCNRCAKYLSYSKEYKKAGFWTFNKNVEVWKISDPDWSYKNTIFKIQPTKW